MIDGGLRPLFRKHIPGFWTAIESGSTSAGIPDAHVIFNNGFSCWIEFKNIKANAVTLRPHQVAWLLRYTRLGGHAFIAIRRRDTLFIFSGFDATRLADKGIKNATPLFVTEKPWDWVNVRATILSGAARTLQNS